MRNFCLLLLIGLTVFSCKEEERTSYVINGSAVGVYDGIRVYLKRSGERGRDVAIDTAIVFDEKFSMTGVIDNPSLHFITVNNVRGKAQFMLENSVIDVNIDKDDILKSTFKGSKSNDSYAKFQEGMTAMQDERKSLIKTLRNPQTPRDLKQTDSLQRILREIGEQMKTYPLTFVEDNPDAAYSLELIETGLKNQRADVLAYKEAYENLSTTLKSTEKGKAVGMELERRYEDFQKSELLSIGKVAPNFEAPDPDGKMVSLNDVKGKVTVIDFWAAWCGPCRRENPNVVRIYDKYHDQGLEIIGVSLDGQSRQKDPKQAWLEAIEKDRLTWTHVSHLKYFNDPVAKQYNINSIPATFILDENGKIVAKNLRGVALENKVQELLSN